MEHGDDCIDYCTTEGCRQLHACEHPNHTAEDDSPNEKEGLTEMDRETYQGLRAALDAEEISYGELADIEAAFADVPDDRLRDLRENAMAGDMLDEIASWLGYAEPRCDICGEPDGDGEPDWNGETGNHLTCENWPYTCGSGPSRCFLRLYIDSERSVQPKAWPVGWHTNREDVERCERKAVLELENERKG